MAKSGQWGIFTSDNQLEVVRSAGNHFCCGVFDENEKIARSPFCEGRIKPRALYVRNGKAPREILYLMSSAHGGTGLSWPTCLPCVLYVHPDVLTGDPVDRLLAVLTPVTEEQRQEALQRLSEILGELAA